MEQFKAPPLLEEELFKHTVVADYVVNRTVRLYSDCFVTLEDPVKKPDDFRVFPLHHAGVCRCNADATHRSNTDRHDHTTYSRAILQYALQRTCTLRMRCYMFTSAMAVQATLQLAVAPHRCCQPARCSQPTL